MGSLSTGRPQDKAVKSPISRWNSTTFTWNLSTRVTPSQATEAEAVLTPSVPQPSSKQPSLQMVTRLIRAATEVQAKWPSLDPLKPGSSDYGRSTLERWWLPFWWRTLWFSFYMMPTLACWVTTKVVSPKTKKMVIAKKVTFNLTKNALCCLLKNRLRGRRKSN